MENIAKGKLKLVKYSEKGSWLQPTINKGEIVTTEVFCVVGIDEDGNEYDLYSIDNSKDNYDEIVSAFKAAKTYEETIRLLESVGYYGGEQALDDVEEIRFETDERPYELVYDSSESPENNQKTICGYFRTLSENYPQYSVGETVYQISNFFKYHIMDLVECLGGMDEVTKYWKELIESYALNPEYREQLKEDIRLSRISEDDKIPDLTGEETEQYVREQLAQIDVDKYVQDLESTIDTFCKSAVKIMKRLEATVPPLGKEKERIELANKVRQLTPGEMVARLYRKTVEIGEYDVKEGNAPIGKAWQNGVTMENMPTEMTHYFEHESQKGCCFVFSTVIMKYLHDLGVKTWLITTDENGDQRASFMYVDNDGNPYVANPVADVEFFTNNGINTPEERAKFFVRDRFSASFNSRADHHDFSTIPLYKFEEMYGSIATYGDFYAEKQKGIKFSEAKSHPMTVEEVYKHLGKVATYEWLKKQSELRDERKSNPTNPEDPEGPGE